MSGTAGLNPTDFDSFAIIVPTGDQVTLASVLLTDTVGDIVEMDWDLRKGSANFTAGTFLETLDGFSAGTATSTQTPLAADTYSLDHTFTGSIPSVRHLPARRMSLASPSASSPNPQRLA